MSTCTTGEDDDEGIGKDFVVAVLSVLLMMMMMMMMMMMVMLMMMMMMRTFGCSRFATSSFH